MKKQIKEDKKKTNIALTLAKLKKIVSWFENGEELDLEEGLRKVREGAKYLKEAKAELKEIDNEFKEVEKLLDA